MVDTILLPRYAVYWTHLSYYLGLLNRERCIPCSKFANIAQLFADVIHKKQVRLGYFCATCVSQHAECALLRHIMLNVEGKYCMSLTKY
jgi:hypothetical protein